MKVITRHSVLSTKRREEVLRYVKQLMYDWYARDGNGRFMVRLSSSLVVRFQVERFTGESVKERTTFKILALYNWRYYTVFLRPFTNAYILGCYCSDVIEALTISQDIKTTLLEIERKELNLIGGSGDAVYEPTGK